LQWSTSTSSRRRFFHGSTEGRNEQVHIIDFEGELYLREERNAILHSTYERAACLGLALRLRGFRSEPAAQRLGADCAELGSRFQHFPVLAEAGIAKVVNGPFTFAPDGNPLVGPVKGLKNYWVALE